MLFLFGHGGGRGERSGAPVVVPRRTGAAAAVACGIAGRGRAVAAGKDRRAGRGQGERASAPAARALVRRGGSGKRASLTQRTAPRRGPFATTAGRAPRARRAAGITSQARRAPGRSCGGEPSWSNRTRGYLAARAATRRSR